MTKQDEENEPIIAPAESRAALPPVLEYSGPRSQPPDLRDDSKIGLISIILGIFAFLSGGASNSLDESVGGSKLELMYVVFAFFSSVCGIALGVLGVRQTSRKRAFAVVGLVINCLISVPVPAVLGMFLFHHH
jgi:hypothetical protein